MSLEKSERYVCIGIDEDSDWVQVTSFIRVYTNLLDKRCKEYPDHYKKESDQYDDEEIVGREYIVKKRLLPATIFKAPAKRKEMSDEEKKLRGERLQQGLQKARKPRSKKVIE